jgi:hypothetical protein
MTAQITLLSIGMAAAVAANASAQTPVRPPDAGRAVTLSLAEYNRLIDLASRAPDGAAPPAAFALASADLRVRVDRDLARGTFIVSGDVLRPGYSRVALLSGATLVEAASGGRPLPLVTDGAVHAALVPGPAPFSLTLEWGAPLVFGPGRASFTLPVPPAGAARASIEVPGDQADVRLSAGLITGRTAGNGRTVVEATLDPGAATEVSWSMRDSAPAAAARPVRALADVMTLVSIGESDVRMVALIDVTVITGELRTAALQLPAGYELTGISGSTVDGSEIRDGGVAITLRDPAARFHQLLIGLERSHQGGSFALDTALVSVAGVQRERGEVAVEGAGTLELGTPDRDGLHRIDLRELNPSLHSLARQPILSAFRYQRTTAGPPSLPLQVKRFDDAGVLAAVAEWAGATTLVTSEGRALTEVTLHVQNRAQPFMKVTLPSGAAMVSVEVGGQTAKPVLGPDGIRVPLMRPGFRPSGRYAVSFVYLHAGTPFARKGDLDMALPRMDVPIGHVSWEVFVPERYSTRVIGGNVVDQRTAHAGGEERHRRTRAVAPPAYPGSPGSGGIRIHFSGAPAGVLRGRVTDAIGAVLPGVEIDLATSGGRKSAISNEEGRFMVAGVAGGRVTAVARLAGFGTQRATFDYDASAAAELEVVMDVSLLSEVVTVSGQAAPLDRGPVPPSENVVNLQKRTAGVLPIRVDVPRAGTSHQFSKPLVVDQDTTVRLRYRRR